MPGSLSLLVNVAPGGQVEAIGNVPAALIGAKWPDVRTWAVLYWESGLMYYCELKSETAAPWELLQIRNHFQQHRDRWTRINAGATP